MFIVGKMEVNKVETKLVRTGKKIKAYQYKLKNLDLFCGKTKNSFALFETVVYNENISGLIPFNRKVTVFHELEQVQIENDLKLKKFFKKIQKF